MDLPGFTAAMNVAVVLLVAFIDCRLYAWRFLTPSKVDNTSETSKVRIFVASLMESNLYMVAIRQTLCTLFYCRVGLCWPNIGTEASTLRSDHKYNKTCNKT